MFYYIEGTVALIDVGLAEGMTVSISASELEDGSGNRIDAPAITDRMGETVSESADLPAGGGIRRFLVYEPENAPQGEYSGTVTFRVSAENFNTALSPLDWVEDGEGWKLDIPVAVKLEEPVLSAARIDSAVFEDGYIVVIGLAMPGTKVAICLAEDETSEGTVAGIVTAGDNGEFSIKLTPTGTGTYYVYGRVIGSSGAMGEETDRIPVETALDQTSPVVALVSPQADVQLTAPVKEFLFTVSDPESAIVGLPTLTVDGTAGTVTAVSTGRYKASFVNAFKDGTHTVEITAVSAGGTTTQRYTIIIGSKIEAVIVVTDGGGLPVEGAEVTLGGKTVITGADGRAIFSVAPGTYEYTIAGDGLIPVSSSAVFAAASREISTKVSAGGELQVAVVCGGEPIEGATVTIGS